MVSHSLRGRHLLVRVSLLGAAVAFIPVALSPIDARAATSPVSYWGSVFTTVPTREASKQMVPVTVDLPDLVVQVATSNSTEYALLAGGEVYAWGLGGEGQLGDGSTADSLRIAVQVRFPAGVTIASLAADAMPYDAALAIDTSGHAWGWGYANLGALCLGRATQYLTPVELPFTDVTAVAGAGDHAVYNSGGTVYACGENHFGDLGDGSTHGSDTPAQVVGMKDQDVEALVASCDNSGVLLADGAYYDWGYDALGQLGDGTIGVSEDAPVQVNLPLPVIQVASGGSDPQNGQTLVELSDGSFRSWGDGQYGQLGNGHTADEPSPVVFSAPAGVTYQLLVSSGSTSYAVSTGGDVYAWGQGGSGQIGNGKSANQLTPVEVETGVSLISATAQDVVTQ